MAIAEILSIGTELLLGQVLDTNAQFIALELAKLGINCFYRTTVGDNKDRIKQAFQNAFERADIVITTGGLGPTADDLTTECLAELLKTELVFDNAVCQRIEGLFASLGVSMPASNKKQALRPNGSQLLPNPVGSAPGIIWEIGSPILEKARINIGVGVNTHNAPKALVVVLTFPGVPREMKAMWQETAAPYLLENHSDGMFWSRELKHYGIGESALAEKYAHLLNLDNPTVAPYAGRWECRLRVTAKAKSEAEAKVLAEPIIQEIIQGSGSLCYGFDDDSLESVLGALLTNLGKTLSVAESCTGGLVSERLTDIPGSSAYIKLNLITYANEAKVKMLGVGQDILDKYGAVSRECAEQMAKGVRKLAESDLGLSITGIAGPGGGTVEKPVGLVYLGLADKNFYQGKKLTYPSHLPRADIRYRAASEALNMVRLYLLGL